MLSAQNAVFVLVDVQEKLSRAMYEKEALVESTVKMVKGAQILGVPIVCSEQNPKGLGLTVPEVSQLLTGTAPVTKFSFSCCGEAKFMEEIRKYDRKLALVSGIETHVCVYQTVRDLVELGYEVQVIADAVSSRTPENRAIGLERCKSVGATLTSVETALFEMLKIAEGDNFKQMLKVVK